MKYRTCTFIRDDGSICKSAAAKDRHLCDYHFEHRARLMRMAQYARRAAQANDPLAKTFEAASPKDAALALRGRRRSAKPSASIALAPQPRRGRKAPAAVPRISPLQIPDRLGANY